MVKQLSFRLLSLALTAAAAVVSAETGFSIDTDVSCNDRLAVTVDYIECGSDGAGACRAGDYFHVWGSMTVSQPLPESAIATFDLCTFGFWPCDTFTTEVISLCYRLNMYSEYGDACPNPGIYKYDFSGTLPQTEEGKFNYMSGWWIGVKVSIVDTTGQTDTIQCHNTMKVVNVVSSAAFVGAIMMAAVAAVYTKKRRVGRINLLDHEHSPEEQPTASNTGNFEMMKDPTSVRV